MKTRRLLLICAILLPATGSALAAPVVFAAAGVDAVAIQSTVDNFRSSVGALNANLIGSFGGGRREINWDGVGDGFAAPNNLPGNFFNANSPRGVGLTTPGTGFQVSANAGGVAAIEFGNIDPSYPGLFRTFSAQRLFTALGSNITDVAFFIPGTTESALTDAFGVVFSDVDSATSTSLEFFDVANGSLGIYFALPFSGDETLSFLGVQFGEGKVVSRLRITSGNAADAVVMDDFIFGEPVAAVGVVAEPGTLALFALALLAAGCVGARRRT